MQAVETTEMLRNLVKELTKGYGESHNHEHAEKVAANAAKIYSAMKEDIPDLHKKGNFLWRLSLQQHMPHP